MADVSSVDIVLKVSEILAIVGSAALALIAVGRSTSRVELQLSRQTEDITDLKDDVKKLSEVITTVALQGQRMDNFSDRLNSLDNRYDTLDKRYDELRRGRGWITGAKGVDGEY